MQVDARTRWINTTVQSVFHLLDGYYADKNTKIVEVNADPTNQWYIVDSKRVTPEQLMAVEEWMNEVIHQDIHTTFTYVKGSDYPDPAYRKYPEVRLVHFGDINTQPYGTCHINHTSQIQSFVILGTKRVSAGTKIFIATNLVTNDCLKQDEWKLGQAAKLLSVKEDHVVDGIQKLTVKDKQLKKRVKVLKQELVVFKVKQILAEDQPINQVRIDDAGEMSMLAPQLLRQVKIDKLLVAKLGGQTSFAIISPAGKARDILTKFRALGQINGGGSPKIVTGTTALSGEQLIQTYESL